MTRLVDRNLLVTLIDAEIAREEAKEVSVQAHMQLMRLREQRTLLEGKTPNAIAMMGQGGTWLGYAREWMKQKFRNGSDVTWGSHEILKGGSFSVWDIEYLAALCATGAIEDTMGHYVKRVAKRTDIPKSHYDWLDANLANFLDAVFAAEPNTIKTIGNGKDHTGMIGAHGDKCYSYRTQWLAAGIPFPHGVAIYMLTYIHPWSRTVRNGEETTDFIAPSEWVVANFPRFKSYLPEIGPEYDKA